jgi:Uri superfamily endonuclease
MFDSALTQPDTLTKQPGTYALLLHLTRSTRIQIGKLGAFDFPRGYYVYVGSAHAPGGIRARVMRHWRETKKLHWHIDYLRTEAKPIRVWTSANARDDECAWAKIFSQNENAKIIAPRFGASDCTCAAHLFYFRNQNDINANQPLTDEHVTT